MVMERLQEEEEEEDITGEPTTTQCTNHHLHKPTSPNGICPFCLQEKLTKLLSSSSTSSSFPIHPSTSSPTSPNRSSRSDFIPPKPTLSTPSLNNSNITHHLNTSSKYHYHQCQSSGAFLQIPFVQTQKKKKNKNKDQEKDRDSSIFFKRSNSTHIPRGSGRDFLANDEYNTPRRRGLFWSLISLSRNPSSKKIEDRNWRDGIEDVSSNGFVSTRKREDLETVSVEEENEESSQETAASDRKVTRSRSVGCGCGSQSFSGDFFDRISTGFGDCALRRVESYRESKQKITAIPRHRGSAAAGQEFIKCSGIFSGFMGTSSSSSSSSSSYLVSSSGEDSMAAAAVRHGRSKSWGWAFASPLRAFNRHSSHGKREGLNKKKKCTSPNLNAIPSILVLRG